MPWARPMPQVPASSPLVHVCVGAEWHRFPGSFFLPGPAYRVQFIQSGFTGLLPRHFNASEVRAAVFTMLAAAQPPGCSWCMHP
jgi:hypothetical protein